MNLIIIHLLNNLNKIYINKKMRKLFVISLLCLLSLSFGEYYDSCAVDNPTKKSDCTDENENGTMKKCCYVTYEYKYTKRKSNGKKDGKAETEKIKKCITIRDTEESINNYKEILHNQDYKKVKIECNSTYITFKLFALSVFVLVLLL
jgi:hypothetical protein